MTSNRRRGMALRATERNADGHPRAAAPVRPAPPAALFRADAVGSGDLSLFWPARGSARKRARLDVPSLKLAAGAVRLGGAFS